MNGEKHFRFQLFMSPFLHQLKWEDRQRSTIHQRGFSRDPHDETLSGASFQLFLGAIFLNFSMPPDYWKTGKKHHFICSNLTLFIVPFFLSFFFFVFSFFYSFFFFLGGGGRRPPDPQMTPLDSICSRVNVTQDFGCPKWTKMRKRWTNQGGIWVDWKHSTLATILRISFNGMPGHWSLPTTWDLNSMWYKLVFENQMLLLSRT